MRLSQERKELNEISVAERDENDAPGKKCGKLPFEEVLVRSYGKG